MMRHKSFVWLCLLPLAVVTMAFFLLPMARLVVTGAEGPQGLAGYLAILTEPRYRATLINTVVLSAADLKDHRMQKYLRRIASKTKEAVEVPYTQREKYIMTSAEQVRY